MKYFNYLNEKLFSFTYGGKSSNDLLRDIKPEVSQSTSNKVIYTELLFKLSDGLEIKQSVREFTDFNAVEWSINLFNNSDCNSQLLENIHDSDIKLPVAFDPKTPLGCRPNDKTLKIYNPTGSNWTRDEYVCREAFIFPGEEKYYAPALGRSSQTLTPFFDVNKEDNGFMLAVGWSGQWCTKFIRDDENIHVLTGLEDCAFFLYPDESIRTTSVLYLPYENGQNAAHNNFRRLIKKHFSTIGAPGHPDEAPLSVMVWGGMTSEIMLKRIRTLKEYDIGYEYFWIDAGWYGQCDRYCPSEFHPGWSEHTGDWVINSKIHPYGLRDVSAAVKESGMKFLLWIEPERVVSTTPVVKEHPEWFLTPPKDSGMEKENWVLLNLAREDVLEYTIKTVADLIEKLDLSCYRQDFNMDPLPFWQLHEQPGRKGMNEIQYITNMYRFWDALLERFPHLIIDNCASGGKRIDLETIKRSIPLWRSDYQCTFDHDSETTQIHNSAISWWLPYSGTGTGFRTWNDDMDTYRYRSAYSSALVTREEETDDSLHTLQPGKMEWLHERINEYKAVRPFFSCDYYSLIPLSLDDAFWTGWQYDRPEQGDGILLFFRRKKSPFSQLTVYPASMQKGKSYRFVCRDNSEEKIFSAEELEKSGFTVTLDKPSSSQLWLYTVI